MKTGWMKFASVALIAVFGFTFVSSSGTAQAAGDTTKKHPDLAGIVRDAVTDAVQKVTGLSMKQLIEAAKDGQSLADVIGGMGDSVDKVKDIAKATISAKLDALVDTGQLTRKQADRIRDRLNRQIDVILNHEYHRKHQPKPTATITPTPAATAAS